MTSDISDPSDIGGSGSIRRYNHFGGAAAGSGGGGGGGGAGGSGCSSEVMCDISDCDSTTQNIIPTHHLQTLHCDNNTLSLEKNELNEQLHRDRDRNLVSDVEKDLCSTSPPPNSSSGAHIALVKLEDIMKESKTSNVNVLVKDNPTNNELLFDSEKYAKYEKTRLKNSVDNLSKAGVKRLKEVNLLHERRGCQSVVAQGDSEDDDTEERGDLAINKKIRLEEKNIQLELERHQVLSERNGDSSVSASSVDVPSLEQQQADKTWRSFVGDQKSAVVDTFYGQFKSSVRFSLLEINSFE